MNGGIDTATFLVIVSAMGGTIVTLATLLWRERDARAKAELALAAYESNAPELVSVMRDLIEVSKRSLATSSQSKERPQPSSSSRPRPRKRPPQ